ncbi:hypothetical protein GCM10012278_13720 [Nonomuraea glycinis]|uniref:Uncharacterized protein n=1 Tax=Nonomuraea glycinis TaxID=2047744 RepID=A0A918A325_9ACTN|nr:hypothetical protein GCM10012278_13720 [Nonomuraea glycinis]
MSCFRRSWSDLPADTGIGAWDRSRQDRVIVDIDDMRRRVDPLGHLMGVARGGDPGADVQELRDALLGDVADRPAEERAVLPRPPITTPAVAAMAASATFRSASKLSLPPSQ